MVATSNPVLVARQSYVDSSIVKETYYSSRIKTLFYNLFFHIIFHDNVLQNSNNNSQGFICKLLIFFHITMGPSFTAESGIQQLAMLFAHK